MEGVIEGDVPLAQTGEEGFGYDPVFRLRQNGKTLAELNFDEKNRLSHRARALEQIKAILKSLGGGV